MWQVAACAFLTNRASVKLSPKDIMFHKAREFFWYRFLEKKSVSTYAALPTRLSAKHMLYLGIRVLPVFSPFSQRTKHQLWKNPNCGLLKSVAALFATLSVWYQWFCSFTKAEAWRCTHQCGLLPCWMPEASQYM